VKISNRLAALEILGNNWDINKVWENIKDNIKITAKDSLDQIECKQHKQCFDEKCSKFADKRKQAKLQCIFKCDNIKRGFQEIGWGCMEWIYLAQDRDKWQALENMVMKLQVP
jgi:hypothetical protein